MAKFFISYRETDKPHKNGFIGLMQNPNNSFIDIPQYSKKDVRNQGINSVKNYIKKIMEPCSVVISLIGNNSHNSYWIDYELDVAKSQKKLIIPIRIPKTNGGLPQGIKNYEIIEWNTDSILAIVNKYYGREF